MKKQSRKNAIQVVNLKVKSHNVKKYTERCLSVHRVRNFYILKDETILL